MVGQPVLGIDVSALTVAEVGAAGIVLVPDELHVDPGAPVWRTHSEYAAMNPAHDRIARGYARDRAAAHFRATGGLEGLHLQRTFPCLGSFRHLEYAGGVRMVQCDRCGEELGVLPPAAHDSDSGRLASVVGPAVVALQAAAIHLQLFGVHQ